MTKKLKNNKSYQVTFHFGIKKIVIKIAHPNELFRTFAKGKQGC